MMNYRKRRRGLKKQDDNGRDRLLKKQDDDGRDRLSELPDEILVHILTFLRIRDAVKTVLLRRFGKLWTLLPTLKFCDFESSRRDYICNVLRYHKNPTIDFFEFNENYSTYMCQYELMDKDLKNWTNFALRKKTKVFIFRCEGDSSKDFVPPRVFRNQYLVFLSLTILTIKLPRCVFMGSLRKLELNMVYISDDTFKKLTSGCHCLQELIILLPYELKHLHFTNPSIERLVLDFSVEPGPAEDRHYSLDCPNLKFLHVEEVFIENFHVIDVSSICEANITCPSSIDIDYDDFVEDYFDPLLEKFRNARVFKLCGKTYLTLESCGNMNWAFQKHTWYYYLALSPGIRGSCMLGLCRLLRNSWYLVKLIIYANVDLSCDCNMLLPELSSPCVMRNLKTVIIRDFVKPCQGLLQLIEFLLKSAVVLEQLVISCDNKDRLLTLEGHKFIFELLSFPRASRDARVVFA